MKRLKINYILVGTVTLLLALALWPNIPWRGGQDGQLAEIKSRGELRVSTLNSPLTYFTTPQGPSGLDYELAKRFANYLGVKLVVLPHQNINDLFDDLDDDNADILAAGLIYNQDRLSRARTGPAYYSVPSSWCIALAARGRKTSPISKARWQWLPALPTSAR
ncbi:Membrane-bound lytic murein transglycosylase F precursor [Serratia odorifera]|uniref:Membrane-bound lytic murein transglycosylase F n=1 Tax=Serratia odorifera TaxID=618 RepID=A0A447KTI6_SEROD|nr:Membrane-bound lytic murein transglycosylase F precursor [Serratia odorifera]